jgi:hypothetical protein
MYVSSVRSYCTRTGEQRASGAFLVLFSIVPGKEVRAAVRHVKMRQCGHWMMGSMKLGEHTITLSGTYGADGLTRDPPEGLWEHLVPLPEELTVEFWKGGGWNSAGAEGPSVRDWAAKNLNVLRKPIKCTMPDV